MVNLFMHESRKNNVGKYLTDNISVRGYSHIVAKKECQDSSVSWHTDKYSGIIVCDGHGGEKYIRSSRGSKLACEIGKAAIDDFMRSIKRLGKSNYKEQLTALERHIINNWRAAIEKDFNENPFENDECYNALSEPDKAALQKNYVKAYGSTFIAAVLTSKYYFILKLGDGNVNIILSNDVIKTPDEHNAEYNEDGKLKTFLEDDQLQFNVTTSLCQSTADTEFRHIFVETNKAKPVCGIVLTTDGIINCFRSVEAYRSLIKNIYHAYLEAKSEKDIEKARLELADGLNQLSEKGSGDDLSVAITIR